MEGSISGSIRRGMHRMSSDERLKKDARVWKGATGYFISFVNILYPEQFGHLVAKLRNSLLKRNRFAQHFQSIKTVVK